MPATSMFDASAPPSVGELYQTHYQQQRDNGKDHAGAHRYALSMIRHAGWYKTAHGTWKRLMPDLRHKVNVREAVKQPNGKYVIEGVDVFYPNAVKGAGLPFTSEDVVGMIRNTNAGIHAGGQKPGLVEGHPNAMQAALGTQLSSLGFGVNWRQSPRGGGMARCDLVDVAPDAVDRMKDLKMTGLSGGIVKDAGGLNRRFGHIALLGGTSQALSHLPVTEIYACDSQLCFSAQAFTTNFSLKGKAMPRFSQAHYDAMCNANAAFEAAYASAAAGEPGSVDKLREAGNMWKAATEAVKGVQDPANSVGNFDDAVTDGGTAEGDNPLATSNTVPGEGAPQTAGGGSFMSYGGDTLTVDGETFSAENFAADPAGMFQKLAGHVTRVAADNNKLLTTLRNTVKVTEMMSGKLLKQEFSAELDGLRTAGHILPGAPELEAEFAACVESPNPRKSLTRLLNTFRSLPKRESPASAGMVFNPSQASRQEESLSFANDDEIRASLARVQSITGSLTLTEEDAAIGRRIG